mgnify:CR=1 FL=1
MKANSTVLAGCPFCGTGCALNVECSENGYKVKGDKTNPSTQGDLCFKPIQMAKALDAHRLTSPLYRKDKTKPFEEISWEEAITLIAQNISDLPREEIYISLTSQLLPMKAIFLQNSLKGLYGSITYMPTPPIV